MYATVRGKVPMYVFLKLNYKYITQNKMWIPIITKQQFYIFEVWTKNDHTKWKILKLFFGILKNLPTVQCLLFV